MMGRAVPEKRYHTSHITFTLLTIVPLWLWWFLGKSPCVDVCAIDPREKVYLIRLAIITP